MRVCIRSVYGLCKLCVWSVYDVESWNRFTTFSKDVFDRMVTFKDITEGTKNSPYSQAEIQVVAGPNRYKFFAP